MVAATQEVQDGIFMLSNSIGQVSKHRVQMAFTGGRIEFLKAPFALKDEIKAMKGARWHGFSVPKRDIWTVEDCARNHFQIGYLSGEDVYSWWDRPLVRHEYERPLMPHQKDLSDGGLTYHYQIFAAEPGCGKTLSAQEVMEKSGIDRWTWVGPAASLPNMEREMAKWNLSSKVHVDWYTFEGLVKLTQDWTNVTAPPTVGLICDESSRLKAPSAKRSIAAQRFADAIRAESKHDGYVILMSGTPSPKEPTNWWSQCEIVWPGYIREGSEAAMRSRMAFMHQQEFNGQKVNTVLGWKDDDRKCNVCGQYVEHPNHDASLNYANTNFHNWVASKNECAYLFERLKGLVIVKHKKDCLTLPEKRYRVVHCKPSASVLRVAKTLLNTAPNTVTGLTLLRELSDGFQYREVENGMGCCSHCQGKTEVEEWFDPTDADRVFEQLDLLDADYAAKLQKRSVKCPSCNGRGETPRMQRIAKEVACPKVEALQDELEDCEETGRIVIFAGFTGSVDRVQGICQKAGWEVFRCDGRGMFVYDADGKQRLDVKPLDYWADMTNEKVAFVAHPESGGMSLTLVEARKAVFWSNSWKPEYRIQAEDRIHRQGMDENLGCEIVDLIHLPSDQKVIDVIRENRRVELMTLGDFKKLFDDTKGTANE